MKRFFILVIFTVVSFTVVSAQNYKWWVGGKSTFWLETDRATVIFAPEVGFHLTPKLALATSVGIYSYLYDKYNNENGLIINPYMRYYAVVKGNLSFFIDAGVEYGLGDIEGFQLGVKPGMAIFLSDRITLALHLGFAGYNDGKKIGGRREGFGFDLSGYQSGFAVFYSF
jgi:hypothetical protein